VRDASADRIRDFPNKLASQFLEKSGESDDLQSQGRRNDPPLPPQLARTIGIARLHDKPGLNWRTETLAHEFPFS